MSLGPYIEYGTPPDVRDAIKVLHLALERQGRSYHVRVEVDGRQVAATKLGR